MGRYLVNVPGSEEPFIHEADNVQITASGALVLFRRNGKGDAADIVVAYNAASWLVIVPSALQ